MLDCDSTSCGSSHEFEDTSELPKQNRVFVFKVFSRGDSCMREPFTRETSDDQNHSCSKAKSICDEGFSPCFVKKLNICVCVPLLWCWSSALVCLRMHMFCWMQKHKIGSSPFGCYVYRSHACKKVQQCDVQLWAARLDFCTRAFCCFACLCFLSFATLVHPYALGVLPSRMHRPGGVLVGLIALAPVSTLGSHYGMDFRVGWGMRYGTSHQGMGFRVTHWHDWRNENVSK